MYACMLLDLVSCFIRKMYREDISVSDILILIPMNLKKPTQNIN